jgi:hypothetical protein
MLRLPASAVASATAPSSGVAAGKADADLIAAEHRPLALARRVLVIDEFALPAAVGAGVGADIVEKCIAAADPAVVQHHDAGIAAVDAVEHPDMNGIKTVADPARSD